MKNIIKFCVLLTITIFSVSCENDEGSLDMRTNNNSNLLNYQKIYKSYKPDGSIVLQSNATGKGINTKSSVTMTQKGDNNRRIELQSEYMGLVTFKDNQPDEKLSDLFGKSLTISNLAGAYNRGPSDSLYIPEELVVDFSSTTIEVGATVNWNMDSLNENGLVVFITYDPLLQADFDIAWDNQYIIEEVFAFEEGNGSYILTEQDINRFPAGATLNFKITRGAYSLATESEPLFIAFTMVSNDVKVKKE